jgi:pyridoxine 4-dehydrogenase
VRDVLAPIAAAHGGTLWQVALAWLLARSPGVMPIPGSTSIAHVRENLAAQDIELTGEQIAAITTLAAEPATV